MWNFSNNFSVIFNTRNGRMWSSLIVIVFLVLNTFNLFADQLSAAAPSSTVPLETNVGSATLAAKLTVATNISRVDLTNSMEALDDSYKLGIGDRLSFKIVEDNDDSKSLQVTDSGDIEFPYIGRFPAVGKTCQQLADELKARYEKEYYLHATVIVAVDFKARSQGKIYLIGAVGVPGPQEIPSDEQFTLSKAILRAGGFTDFADQHHVRVTRKEPGQKASENKVYIVDVGKILTKGQTDLDMDLESGDFIYIPEKMLRF